MKKKKTKSVEQEINDFLDIWTFDRMSSFLDMVMHLVKVYDVDEKEDWIADECGPDNARNVRMLRTVYMMSKIADFHGPTFLRINMEFKDLWKRMKQEVEKPSEPL